MVHTPEKPAAQLSSQSTHTPGSSGKKQYSLLKFLGTPEQQAAAKPALSGAKPELYKRSQTAQCQLDHEAELAALRQQVTELQLTQAETQEERAAIVERSKIKLNKRSFSDVLALEDTKPGSSNRKKPGAQRARLELSAQSKLKYCEEKLRDKDRFAHLSDFWEAQKNKYGFRKDQLQRILKQQGSWLRSASRRSSRASSKWSRSTESGMHA